MLTYVQLFNYETPQLLWLYSAENFDAIHVLHPQEAEKSMRERRKSLGQKEKRKKGRSHSIHIRTVCFA
jgi:hypothetical protein